MARQGFEAMMKGEGGVITRWQNKLQVASTHLMPADLAAEAHRRQAAPVTPQR